MEFKRKRHCRHCGERIRHTARRCPYCLTLTLPWRYYFGACLVLILLVILLLKYLGVF